MEKRQEAFWNSKDFVVITDNTKPAIKLTIDELQKRGKKVHVVDMSGRPQFEGLKEISQLPDTTDTAVIGVTESEPADVINALVERGIKNIWVHWRTETPEVKALCESLELKCITGRCPMMYLGNGVSIHGLHRAIAKMTGKY